MKRRTRIIAIIMMAVLLMSTICHMDSPMVQAATKIGNGMYTVTNEKKKTARYDGVAKKSVTTVAIPATVKIGKKTYKVTAIKANALKGNKKIKKLTIGKNVKTIGKNALYGCKNLKTIVIKTTGLTTKSVGKNAFKGLYSKVNIKVPAGKLATYQKLLKTKGVTGKKQTMNGKSMTVVSGTAKPDTPAPKPTDGSSTPIPTSAARPDTPAPNPTNGNSNTPVPTSAATPNTSTPKPTDGSSSTPVPTSAATPDTPAPNPTNGSSSTPVPTPTAKPDTPAPKPTDGSSITPAATPANFITTLELNKTVEESEDSNDKASFVLTADIPEIAPDEEEDGEWVEKTVPAKYCTCGYGPGTDEEMEAHIAEETALRGEKVIFHSGWMTKEYNYRVMDDPEKPETITTNVWVASQGAVYSPYMLTFHDEIPAGMNCSDITVSVVNGNQKGEQLVDSSLYNAEVSDSKRELEVTIDNIHNAAYSLSDGGKIIVRYTADTAQGAEFDSTGAAYLECRNGKGEGNTASTTANVTTLTLQNAKECNYDVFQVFIGEMAADGRTLDNIKYGKNYKAEGQTVSSLELDKIQTGSFARRLEASISGSPVASLTTKNPSVELPKGYYIIQGQDSGRFSPLILVNQKTDYNASLSGAVSADSITMPGISKTSKKEEGLADRINFTLTADFPEIIPDEREEGKWEEVKEFPVICPCGAGPFTGTMFAAHAREIADKYGILEALNHGGYRRDGSTMNVTQWEKTGDAVYSPYSLTFHDSLPEGLDCAGIRNVSVSIINPSHGKKEYVMDQDSYTKKISADKKELTVTIPNICDDVYAMMDGGKVIVSYKADINHEDAELKNINRAWLECKNGMDQGVTAMDSHTVMAYSMDFNLVNDKGESLDDATFVLQTDGSGVYDNYDIAQMTGSSFHFTGLPAGNYILVEEEAPAGYKKTDKIYFTIVADADDTSVKSLKMVDADGNELLTPDGDSLWAADLSTGTLSSSIVHEVDEKQQKTIRATVQYSYAGTIESMYTHNLEKSVHALMDSAKIEKGDLYFIDLEGYKFDCIMVNGEKVEQTPETFHDGDIITYVYVVNEDEKKDARITVRYYQEGNLKEAKTYTESIPYLSSEVSTSIIPDAEDKYEGYKLSKIMVGSEEVDSLPQTVPERTVISFYYTVDDNSTKTLSVTIQHMLNIPLEGEVMQDGDTFTYRKEVQTAEPDYIKSDTIPIKEYFGFTVDYYKINNTSYTSTKWKTANIPNGTVVTIYYEPDYSLTAEWTAKVQYKCGEDVRETIPLSASGSYWDLVTGLEENGLSTKRISAKSYSGYTLSSITLNGNIVTSLPDMLNDKDVVVFQYVAKSSSVTAEYKDEDGNKIADFVVKLGLLW